VLDTLDQLRPRNDRGNVNAQGNPYLETRRNKTAHVPKSMVLSSLKSVAGIDSSINFGNRSDNDPDLAPFNPICLSICWLTLHPELAVHAVDSI
jgi:hypothetical protein